MLRRPVHRFARRLAMLGAALILGALACSVLQIPGGPPAGAGGAVGWALLRLITSAGLAPLALPVAMTAAALVALLLLSIIGLSPGDWRVIGGGAGRGAARLARASGYGTLAAAAFGGRMWKDWRAARRVLEAGPKAASFQTVVSRKPIAETRSDPRVTPLPTRREPKLGLVPPIAAKEAEEPESMPGRLVRFVMPRAKPAPPGKRATQEAQPVLALDGEPILPPLNLLTKAPATRTETVDEEALSKNARMLEAVLEDFGVRGRIVQVRPGPVVTLYELEPAPGIKASRVIGLADDIARSMSAISVRVAVVPGRTVIGIELPNLRAETVYLRELLDSPVYEKHAGRLALALGKDIGGEPVIADLARMPHLLIAGTTGSGKSVGINTMILSILYRMPPGRCKFMLVAGKEIEASVQRLAQMARAAGIHLIMATQRPSVDVITGTIKANFPTRVSFQVTSKIDSRTILGEGGAEQLLGRGDMLYMAGGGRVTRVHGPFVSDEEVERVVSFLKRHGEPQYLLDITEDDGAGGGFDGFGGEDEGGSGDALYDQAVALVTRERKASTSFVQRYLQIGYNRAARLIERMEAEGVVSPANHVGKREVLAPPPR